MEVPLATYYAACGLDNQISEVNGQQILVVGVYGTFSFPPPTNAYDCCVDSLTYSGSCAGYYFVPGESYLSIPNDTTCVSSNNDNEFAYLGEGGNNGTLGNSNCGSFSL